MSKSTTGSKAMQIELLAPQTQARAFDSPQEKVELRSLVMQHGFMLFESNTDLQSHNVCAEHVRYSKEGQTFFQEHRVTR